MRRGLAIGSGATAIRTWSVSGVVLAALLATAVQALSLTRLATNLSIAPLTLFLVRVALVSLGTWAATSLPLAIRAVPAAAGALIGTVALWAAVLVHNDSQEVGTAGAVLEGALIGAAIAVPGAALFLFLRLRTRGL